MKDYEIEVPTTHTLDTMLHSILNQALVAINAEAGSLMLVDHKEGILQIKSRLGKPRKGRKKEPVYRIGEKGIAGKVVQSGQTHLSGDVSVDPYFSKSASGSNFLSLLSVPIKHDGVVIAVLNADSDEKNYFTNDSKRTLENIAIQIGKPIAERMSIFEALAQVSVELMKLPTHGGSVEVVLQKIAEAAIKSLGADIVTLYQYDQNSNNFLVKDTGPTMAGEFNMPEFMRRSVYENDVPSVIVRERISGFYNLVEGEKMLVSDLERPNEKKRPRFVEREGIKSMAALLLPSNASETNEEVVGVMFANYREPHDFNFDERQVLKTFSDYAAIAILNARQEEKRRKEQMSMVESFAANFAHKMSNLAGISRVNTQLLRERKNFLDPSSEKLLSEIQKESEILLNLARRLARPFKEKGRMLVLEPLDIVRVIRIELDRLKYSKTFTYKLSVEDNLPKALSVDFQIREVLYDILKNSLEANDTEDVLIEIGLTYNSVSNEIFCEIKDNGKGIPENMLDRLFSPGTTTKKENLGIGLWWSKTFMQACGGDLTYRNVESGASFVITLPCEKK